jgi:hypothetical protein
MTVKIWLKKNYKTVRGKIMGCAVRGKTKGKMI